MADKSKIEWTDATWPIVQGCDPVSPGCAHCYAVNLLWRMQHNPDPKVSGPIQGVTEKHVNRDGETILRFTGKVALREDRLDWPLQWRRPRMIFVPSHGDLFHKDVSDAFIDKVFGVMGLAQQHKFQVLTKRADRMRAYFASRDADTHLRTWARANPFGSLPKTQQEIETRLLPGLSPECRRLFHATEPVFPLTNVWLGVSAERQQEADERIPILLQTPAAVRFVSLEPLLGPIDLDNLHVGENLRWNAIGRQKGGEIGCLDWVIVGGESGKDARPMHPDWARSLRDQCQAAGVSFFFKQWGEWAPYDRGRVDSATLATPKSLDTPSSRFGKKLAGRLLDGVEHSAFPETHP